MLSSRSAGVEEHFKSQRDGKQIKYGCETPMQARHIQAHAKLDHLPNAAEKMIFDVSDI